MRSGLQDAQECIHWLLDDDPRLDDSEEAMLLSITKREMVGIVLGLKMASRQYPEIVEPLQDLCQKMYEVGCAQGFYED